MNFIGQDLPALGDDWQVETQFTARYTAGWQHVGLIVWQSDGNFFRSTLTHSLSGGNLYVEQSKDTPTPPRPRACARRAAATVTIAPNKAEAGHDQDALHARHRRQQRHGAVPGHRPGGDGQRRLGQLPGHDRGLEQPGGLQLNPTGQPRRDSAGSRIGIISAGNFPGTTGNHPYTGTPAT